MTHEHERGKNEQQHSASVIEWKQRIHVDDAKFMHLLRVYHRLEQLSQSVNASHNADEQVQQWETSVAEVREAVHALRCAPLWRLFSRLTRLSRDMARMHNASVDIHSEGEQIEVDQRILDYIGDVLLCWLRDTFGHGFASPETRQTLGKPLAWNVALRAVRHEHNVVISISDDGMGIDAMQFGFAMKEGGFLDLAHGVALHHCRRFTPIFDAVVQHLHARGIDLDVWTEVQVGTTLFLTLPSVMMEVASPVRYLEEQHEHQCTTSTRETC